MTGTRDTRPASWRRTVNRLRHLAEILRDHGFEVREPADLDTPPFRRIANTSTDV